tara:strand:- start:4119 stop:4985 length:867 start_codon:yes stop_codon:yes gene_type:complete
MNVHLLEQQNFTWQKVDSNEYRKISGIEISSGCYTSLPINQHKSSWCGCCYMVSVLQMIQDRIHVKLGKKNKTRMFPWLVFDLQSMLDHYQLYKAPYSRGWNACKGGIPLNLLNAIETQKCPLIFSKNEEWFGHPREIDHVKETNIKITVKNSKRIVPTRNVEERILNHGPVVLSISGALLKNIDKNGFVDGTKVMKANHAVSVVGWIYKHGKKYWIARNSWGEKEVPVSFPDDMSCVTTTGNNCKVKTEKWVGDPQNPGFVYIPSDYILLNDDENSPWFEAEVFIEE